jgi:hypothetical protein
MAALAALAAGFGSSGIGPSVTGAYGAPLWNQLAPTAAASAGGQPAVGPSNVITYSEDVPCDPTPGATTADPKVVHRRPLHKVRRRPIAHKTIVHKVVLSSPAPVKPKPIPVVHRPAIHKAILHKVVAKPHHRRVHTATAAVTAAAPKRCVVLHSERLNTVALGYDGGAALDPPAALMDPAALTDPDATPDFGVGGGAGSGGFGGGDGGGGGGGGAFPNIATGGGGGGVTTGTGASSGSVSAAPEPQTWMLMILGVGLCGAALRRNRRTGSVVA